jgi:hypothetical protein
LVIYSSNRWQNFFRKNNTQIISFILLLPCIALLLSFLHPALHPSKIAGMIQYNYFATLKMSKGHNVFIFEHYTPSPTSALAYVPEALAHGLFGPYWWNSQKMISFIVSLENAALLALFLIWVIQQVKNWKTIQLSLPIVAVISYIVVLATLMAFSPPNWGTLIRYKAAYSCFFYLLVLQGNPVLQWVENRFRFLKIATPQS